MARGRSRARSFSSYLRGGLAPSRSSSMIADAGRADDPHDPHRLSCSKSEMEPGRRGDKKKTNGPETAPAPSMPFGSTVTLLFSDIRGFTEYTDQYGDEAAFQVLQEHNAIVRKQIETFGGQVVKTQGDSFMVAFTTARGAIMCAVAIQLALGKANRNQTGTRIAIGIGINTGEPIQEGGDFFGGTVNLAARICAAAGPGEIFIAETTRYVAGRSESIDYVDRGLHELKGFQEPQRLIEVRWQPSAAEAPSGAQEAERSEEHTSELQSQSNLVCRLLLEKKKNKTKESS